MTEKKKIYHIEFDIEDDVEKFVEKTGDKSEDIGVISEHIMLEHIKKAIKRFSDMELFGVYLSNIKLSIPLQVEKD